MENKDEKEKRLRRGRFLSWLFLNFGPKTAPAPPAPTDVDLSNAFTWEDGAYSNTGGKVNATIMKRSSLYDVSAYQGKTMVITWCAVLSSSSGRPSWRGLIFYDSSNTLISAERVALASNIEPGKGYTLDGWTLTIPSDAVTFKTIYFRDDVDFTISPFSCKIVL